MRRRFPTWTVACLLLSALPAQADILWEYWTDLSGNAVTDLTMHPDYPDRSTGMGFLERFETPRDWDDDYGARVRGTLLAPVTGSYVFWISGNEQSELWLSPDDNPNHARRIAEVRDWTPPRQWNWFSSQKSEPIPLVAGEAYYIEALHKEGWGGDNLAVGWARPGQSTVAPSEVIPGPVLLPWTGPDASNRKPLVSAPGGLSLDEAPVTIQLAARVKDDGLPLPAHPERPDEDDPNRLRWAWSVVSPPTASRGVAWSGSPAAGEAFTYEGSPERPETVFVSDPCASFDVPGQYVLAFRASDGETETVERVGLSIRSTGIYRALGYAYLSPVPSAEYVAAEARQIVVRFSEIAPEDLINLSMFITVTGSRSGAHSGRTRIAMDDRTVIFAADVDFDPNEVVTVDLTPRLRAGVSGSVEPYSYRFLVDGHVPDPPAIETSTALPSETSSPAPAAQVTDGGEPSVQSNGVSIPSDFPRPLITVNRHPSPGVLFLESWGQGGSRYTMMLDNQGEAVWYRRGGGRGFRVQENGLITWGAFTGVDRDFNWVRDYGAANGYDTDDHELKVLEDGGYLLIGHRDQVGVDLGRYLIGGHSGATVHETAVQVFTPADELVLQFRAWDHFDVADTEPVVENPRGAYVRFSHMNAIDVDDDGHLLISSRHVSEVTKVDRNTGQVMWRLGGPHSDFVFVDDPLHGFRNQHDVSALGHGRYLLFDNGNGHSPPVSRAVEYQLDLEAKTAALVWEFRDTPDRFTHYMGNAQRLPNGNTLINFALSYYPKVTEVDPNGVKQFEMSLQPGLDLYRAYRFPWEGVVASPYLLVEAHEDHVALIYNKFGDTRVAGYRIYEDTSPQPTVLLAETESTLTHLTDLESRRSYYFRVTAVDVNGVESPFSNEEEVFVNFASRPGVELVRNGDFSQGQAGWSLALNASQAQWGVVDEVAHVAIAEGGTTFDAVQLGQTGIALTQGERYVLAMDIWAAVPRVVEIKLERGLAPHTDYSRLGFVSVTSQKTRRRFEFTMNALTDTNAGLVINAGLSPAGLYLDNVSLKQQSDI